jgi:site-specific DNA-methyltransferase (adenine-specific)
MNITNEDNMDLMSRYDDNHFDLAIVDPPYGLGKKIYSGGEKGCKFHTLFGENKWDDNIPPKEYFDELFRVSKNQIIWGGNYFDLPPTRTILCWDKMKGDNNFSMWEMAWTSFDKPAKIYRQNSSGDRIHPTQKPVKLYEWLLMKYAKEGDKILDTHLGSGSIAIACHNLGFDLTACELDKEYYDAAMKRLNNHKLQQKLF